MLVDVQALALQTAYGTPRRTTNGFDAGRLALLLAVLEKRAGVSLFNQDVYINVAGGLELSEPAADLSLCAAVASSVRDVCVPPDWAVIGEVGLAGEIRAVSQGGKAAFRVRKAGLSKRRRAAGKCAPSACATGNARVWRGDARGGAVHPDRVIAWRLWRCMV